MRFSLRGLAAALLALSVAVVCVRLGMWQLSRLEERRERNAAIASAMVLPLLRLEDSLAAVMARPEGYVYRRVVVAGTYDHPGEVVIRGRAEGGRPGVHVVSPLRVVGDTLVLVNRGWVPSVDAATIALEQYREEGRRRVEGIFMAAPPVADAVELRIGEGASGVRTFARLPLGQLQRETPGSVLPLYIQQIDDRPDAEGLPARLGVPELDEGPHLGYAVQWFGFAAVALVGLMVVVYVRGRGTRGGGAA